MRVGENPHKVRNIVAAQLPAFRSLYGGLLKAFWKSVHTIGEVHPTNGGPHEQGGVRLMRQDLSAAVRASTAVRLPVGLRDKVLAHYERKWNLEGAMLRAKEHDAHDAPDRAEHKVNLDVQYMWERIVQDDEFKAIMNQSASLSLALFPPFSLSSSSLTRALLPCRPVANRRPPDLQPVAQGHPLGGPGQVAAIRRPQAQEEVGGAGAAQAGRGGPDRGRRERAAGHRRGQGGRGRREGQAVSARRGRASSSSSSSFPFPLPPPSLFLPAVAAAVAFRLSSSLCPLRPSLQPPATSCASSPRPHAPPRSSPPPLRPVPPSTHAHRAL